MATDAHRLRRRQQRSAAVCLMILLCLHAYRRDLPRRSMNAALPGLLVGFAVRVCEERNRGPITISRLARVSGLSRQTVRTAVNTLIKRGFIFRSDGDGVFTNPKYLASRIDAPYFKTIVRAVHRASAELRRLDAEEADDK